MELKGILSKDKIDTLSIIYLVLLTPSVIGSFSVLVVSIVKWRRLKEQVLLLVQLALADLMAALILMFTSAMNTVTIGDSVTICQHSLPLSLTFYFISFLLVVVYAWKSKNTVQGGWRERAADDETGRSWCKREITSSFIPVYAIVWLVPFAMYLGYILTSINYIKAPLISPSDNALGEIIHDNNTYYCTSCILFLHVWKDPCPDNEQSHDIFIRFFLFVVVIPVIVSCSVIYYKVGKWYEKRDQDGLFPPEGDGRSRKRFKAMFSTSRNMVLVILVCWTPALILILLSILMLLTSNIEQQSLFGLYMIQAAGVSLQGFLNSMVYAWRRPNFTEAVLGEHTPLLTYDRQPYFDESLRSSI